MRTYTGKYLDDDLIAANGFAATVKEDSFDITDELLNLALADEEKYYPDEVAATAVYAGDGEFYSPETAPKYIPSPTFAQKMLRADEIIQDRYDELKNYALRF